MKLTNWIVASFLAALAVSDIASAEPPNLKPMPGTKVAIPDDGRENHVRHRCLTPPRSEIIQLPLNRAKPWSLPSEPLSAAFDTTINILVLRFNFQYEDTDDPNTTGRGVLNLSTDTLGFFESEGHFIDPPPHNTKYFEAHMQALRRYYEQVSEGKLSLSWDIYPSGDSAAYELPHPMSNYGRCDSVVIGLENYFVDCITVADSVSPEIHFDNYQSVFLFHAGSDRQNDIGFPETCNDLFTGFIRYGDSVAVDTNSHYVRTGLIVPETSSQDNRATAINAVLAHEFGHQLGLVDLYDTRYFLTQVGDFALMDNNGFGTGIDFDGFSVGHVFGAIPLYPSAWSRAYLGFVEVYDFRRGTDIRIAAAEVVSSSIKIARVPISDKEYYLIENRLVDTDGLPTVTWADRETSVIQGPGREGTPPLQEAYLTGEYDFLMPGSGLLIYHIDEGVMGLDYDGDGQINFEDNDLQWDWDRRFMRLVEADGLVNFGGGYNKGFGKEDDMFRDDRQNAFTPNTNPPTTDNSGNNSRIHITNISRVIDSSAQKPVFLDTLMSFDVETDKLVPGFPKRAGYPFLGLNPVVDDIDRDGVDEIIVASRDLLSVITTTGESFMLNNDSIDCSTCPEYEDLAIASIHGGRYSPVGLYAQVGGVISTQPVTGDFGQSDKAKYIAVGYNTRVELYRLLDNNDDGQADHPTFSNLTPLNMSGRPIAVSFGDVLWVLSDIGSVVRVDSLSFATVKKTFEVPEDEFFGMCRLDKALIVMAGSEIETKLYFIDADTASFSLGGYYEFGPILVDVDRNGIPEVAAFSSDGRAVLASVDLSLTMGPLPTPVFSIHARAETDFIFTTNPIAGDIDSDGYPDLIIGGVNAVYAFNGRLVLKTDFPIEAGRRERFANDDVIWAPIMADIERGGRPEIIFPTNMGNLYSYGEDATYGFPLSAGEKGAGSAVFFADSTGGKLGYLGADGWFYAWEVDADLTTDYWPMGGHDPSGTFAFDSTKLTAPKQLSSRLPADKFYNYPNPVVEGNTTFRYALGDAAQSALLTIYDLSGVEIARLDVPVSVGEENDYIWNCGEVTPGVYRCILEVDFGGSTESVFTDVAIIR